RDLEDPVEPAHLPDQLVGDPGLGPAPAAGPPRPERVLRLAAHKSSSPAPKSLLTSRSRCATITPLLGDVLQHVTVYRKGCRSRGAPFSFHPPIGDLLLAIRLLPCDCRRRSDRLQNMKRLSYKPSIAGGAPINRTRRRSDDRPFRGARAQDRARGEA